MSTWPDSWAGGEGEKKKLSNLVGFPGWVGRPACLASLEGLIGGLAGWLAGWLADWAGCITQRKWGPHKWGPQNLHDFDMLVVWD